MTDLRKTLGAQAEELAKRHLQRKGIKVLARNVKLSLGEIDLVAQDGDVVVIVEVKAKTGSLFGPPEGMVNAAKQRKLWQLASAVSLRFPGKHIRIDVVAVDWSKQPPTIEHIENAVTF